jgi:hypothetical protein
VNKLNYTSLDTKDMPFVSSVEGSYSFGRATTLGFNYPDFASTTGLVQVSTVGVISNLLYLTQTAAADVGNVYRSTAIPYNRNFTFEWNFECVGGSTPPADGFCLQWTTTNDTNGPTGGGVGLLSTAA